ncbi:DNA binding domain protein, excisionase family [Kribbella flavida DSM 17836]|uniref:DNA binding domain protein, excisionase family n=1 Tax=Kribbella flavida (strain DSM 17836 / JCM 10339 / NBRC 14399) TaxID=479435 RepID=D2PSD5_KRIFD|nr:helix-turn-helix domain-containing protein [Kribbella flavida]ADB31259.1 DNA binding domain protein, excisionase family [Kribbella flavida DSM 17836]
MNDSSTDAGRRPWLTVEETAKELGLSAMTVYRAIAAGAFPAVRVGRRIVVPAGAIDSLAKAAIERGAVISTADWREVLMTG